MTEMQKTVRIQFNRVTINGKVMFLRLFAMTLFEQALFPISISKNDRQMIECTFVTTCTS